MSAMRWTMRKILLVVLLGLVIAGMASLLLYRLHRGKALADDRFNRWDSPVVLGIAAMLAALLVLYVVSRRATVRRLAAEGKPTLLQRAWRRTTLWQWGILLVIGGAGPWVFGRPAAAATQGRTGRAQAITWAVLSILCLAGGAALVVVHLVRTRRRGETDRGTSPRGGRT